jgi:low temperature requirement protein LtrA
VPDPPAVDSDDAGESGKRVSWVELYLDLMFVLAIGELARLNVETPAAHTVWSTLGLFVALWWTWIGFAVLYNRHGTDAPRQRLLVLAASVPIGVAAVAVAPASAGHPAVFAGSMVATRLLLAGANAQAGHKDRVARASARAYGISAVLFTISIWLPHPFDVLIWTLAIAQESRVVLWDGRPIAGRAKRRPSLSEAGETLDAHHFAERFGLFVIILIGEVVLQAGDAADAGHIRSVTAWASLAAAVVLAGELWWAYFDSAADNDLRVLELSGGSPRTARAIFAIGHMVPTFGLLLTASGVGLLLQGNPPRIAYWLACVGAGIYLSSTHGLLKSGTRRVRLVRTLLLVLTFAFGALGHVLEPDHYLWALTVLVGASVLIGTFTSARQPAAKETAAGTQA